jgi:hypothetical protein
MLVCLQAGVARGEGNARGIASVVGRSGDGGEPWRRVVGRAFGKWGLRAGGECEEHYGVMPCSTSLGGNAALLAAYGYMLLQAAQLLSDGSELLLTVMSPGIIGGLVLPVLGAFPDALLIAGKPPLLPPPPHDSQLSMQRRGSGVWSVSSRDRDHGVDFFSSPVVVCNRS